MQERDITVTLEKAKEWYNSDNVTLKEIALQAFSKEELMSFIEIKTFEDALNALGYVSFESRKTINETIKNLSFYSKASAAMFKLNIIREALNRDYNLRLTKNAEGQEYAWYPYFRFATKDSTYYNDELKNSKYKKLGEISSEGITYDVLGGGAYYGGYAGLGDFDSSYGVGAASANVGFLGCATKEIAKHFGKYFSILIIEAMYGDIIDIKITNE